MLLIMKWTSVSTKSRQEIYELWDAEEKLLTLIFHPDSGSVRITADNEKRVFLVGREGLLRSRTVLGNEYGIRMAQLHYVESYQQDHDFLILTLCWYVFSIVKKDAEEYA